MLQSFKLTSFSYGSTNFSLEIREPINARTCCKPSCVEPTFAPGLQRASSCSLFYRLIPRPGRPYIIRSDLTVMPGATLTIEPGVEMEFYPGVGILVLGTMHAQGNLERNIIMRPVELENVQDYR